MRTVQTLINCFDASENFKETTNEFELSELQLLIDKADQRYYRIGQSELITDEQYDAARLALKDVAPEDIRMNRVGVPYNQEELRIKISHTIPMGSIDNIDDGIFGYSNWYQKICKTLNVDNINVVASLKIDGGSLRLRYKKGQLIEAVTRGNGEVGENITANAANFIGVPTILSKPIDLDVRGEAVLYIKNYHDIRSRDYSCDFDKIPKNEQSNPRNIGNGIFGRDDGKDSELINFIAFNVHNNISTEQIKFKFLRDMGFKSVPHLVCDTIEDVNRFYAEVVDNRDKLPFEIDGIIVCLNHITQQQRFITDDIRSVMRPKYMRAIKFPHKTNTTVLKDVELTVGHTGAIIPTAVLEEVRIGGVNVTHALLNNWDEIERLNVAIGDIVEVILSGDVIPKCVRIVKPANNRILILEPKRCPSCGEQTTRTHRGKFGAVTYCRNTECPEMRLQKINHWIGSSKKGVGILGVGDTILRSMWDEQIIQDAADLYALKISDIENLQLDGVVVGNLRATKIISAISSRSCLPLHIFLGSLGIELLGRRRVQILMKEAAGKLDRLSDWLDDQKIATIQLNGFGDAIRIAVRNGINENHNIINKMQKNGVIIDYSNLQIKNEINEKENETSDKPLTGITCCWTGTRAYIGEFEHLGGIVKSGISKGLHLLVQKDPLSVSNKTKKAESYGVVIISINSLKRLINGELTIKELGL